ncbi:hypothetical protein IAQ61_011098 [Plenodomus lingam]|uniref:uncharacterized protein n=1 Tax=Leptosphaeria maculans TaxID=5022 RepID=UPI003319EDBF|nr:hypothetical protein IAQ61_011098 [Plenodomus lingam]
MAAMSTHAMTQIRRYSSQLPRDPHYRLKATLATGYVVSALALPFVPPLLETRRAKADGSDLTKCVVLPTLFGCCRIDLLVLEEVDCS